MLWLDTETESAHHVATIVGDFFWTPWRHPDPIDAELIGVTVKTLANLLFNDIGERTSGARQCHFNDQGVVVDIPQQVIDESEIDDVDPEFWVDDLFERFDELVVALVGKGDAIH